MKKLFLLALMVCFACKPNTNETPLYSYDIEEKIKDLNIELHDIKVPDKMKLELVVQSGNMLYLSGNIPFAPNGEKHIGKLGSDLTAEEGYKAARLVGIKHLSTLKWYLGDLNRVEKIVKVLGMVNSEPDFINQPTVINGFSDLMFEVFGERGKHARSAVGLASIPRNAACEIEMIVQIKD